MKKWKIADKLFNVFLIMLIVFTSAWIITTDELFRRIALASVVNLFFFWLIYSIYQKVDQ